MVARPWLLMKRKKDSSYFRNVVFETNGINKPGENVLTQIEKIRSITNVIQRRRWDMTRHVVAILRCSEELHHTLIEGCD